MKKYSLHLITFKERKVREKIKREIIKVRVYNDISFDLAKYLAVKKGCGLRFIDRKGKLCLKDKAYSATGFCYYDKTIALINTEAKPYHPDSTISIFPDIPSVFLSKDMIRWEGIVPLIEKWKENFFDYSIEAFHIWGPMALIPKGYVHVTSGEVHEGDYYFDKEMWLDVGVSFSSIKAGQKIGTNGILYSGIHSGHAPNETIDFYNEFVIRPKLS